MEVTLDIQDGWSLEKAWMWIGTGVLPVRSYRYSANPAHFPFSTQREGEHKFRFRSSSRTCLYFAVHVKVCRERTVAPTPLPTLCPRLCPGRVRRGRLHRRPTPPRPAHHRRGTSHERPSDERSPHQRAADERTPDAGSPHQRTADKRPAHERAADERTSDTGPPHQRTADERPADERTPDQRTGD